MLISSSLSAKALGDFDQPSVGTRAFRVAEFRDSPAAENSRVETQMWSVEDSAYNSSVLCFVLMCPCALDNTSFLPSVRVASLQTNKEQSVLGRVSCLHSGMPFILSHLLVNQHNHVTTHTGCTFFFIFASLPLSYVVCSFCIYLPCDVCRVSFLSR